MKKTTNNNTQQKRRQVISTKIFAGFAFANKNFQTTSWFQLAYVAALCAILGWAAWSLG